MLESGFVKLQSDSFIFNPIKFSVFRDVLTNGLNIFLLVIYNSFTYFINSESLLFEGVLLHILY